MLTTHGIIPLCIALSVAWGGIGIFLCSALELTIPAKLTRKQLIVFSIINGPIFFVLVIGLNLSKFIIAACRKSQPALDSFKTWLYK